MKQRLEEFEILRAVACISVIVIHVSAAFIYQYIWGSLPSKLMVFINGSVKYAVPAFVFISGFMLAKKYRGRKIIYPKYFKKKFLAILLPYIIWSAIYYLYYMRQGIYPASLKFFIKNLLLGTTIYHLYYIVIIVQFYALTPLWLYLARKLNARVLIAIAALLNYASYRYFYFGYSDRFFVTYLAFFIMGLFFAENYDAVRKRLAKYRLLIVGIFMFALADYVYKAYQFYGYNHLAGVVDFGLFWYIYSIVAITALLAVALAFAENEGKWKEAVKKISQASYYMYLAHPLLIILCIKLIGVLKIESLTAQFLFQIVVVTTASYCCSIGYLRFKESLKNLKKSG